MRFKDHTNSQTSNDTLDTHQEKEKEINTAIKRMGWGLGVVAGNEGTLVMGNVHWWTDGNCNTM